MKFKVSFVLACVLATATYIAFGVSARAASAPYPYSRYGDFKSAQLRSTSTHGYGLYVAEMQMSPSPTVSTFWLYGDSPSAIYMQDVTQLWRWNEIDFEFVPYTHSVQPQYMTFTWNDNEPITDLTYYGADLALSSVLVNMPGSETASYASWVEGMIRTDDLVAQQNMNSAAGGLSYTGGAPTGGTFTIVVATESGSVSSSAIDYNASASDVNAALQTMSDGDPFLSALLPSGFVVNEPGPAGGSCSVTEGSSIIGLPSGLTPQISPGDLVSQPSGTAVIATGTTVVSVDRTANTAVISPAATGTNSAVTLNFQHPSSWNIVFNNGASLTTAQMPNIFIDMTNLTPSGTVLGKIIPGLNSNQAATGLTVSVFQTPLAPATGQSWLDFLAANTGPGQIYTTASQWKYPLTTLQSPEDLPISRMGSTNFWRAPVGDTSVSLDIPTYGTFNRQGIVNGPLAGASDSSYYTSAVFNNEAFFWDSTGIYDPYTALYTYVIIWTPTRMAQYVLPKLEYDEHGLPIINIDGMTPIVDFDLTDFPSLAQSGPQADPTTTGTTPSGTTVDGGTVPFAYTELDEQIDHVSLNLANYVGYVQASSGYNGSATVNATYTAGSMVIADVNSFTAQVNSVKANPIVELTDIATDGTPAADMFITADNATLVPANTQIAQVWTNAYLTTLSAAAAQSGTGQFTFTPGTGSPFTLSGYIVAGQTEVILPTLSGNTIMEGMTVTSNPTSLLPGGTVTVSTAPGATATYAELTQSPSATGNGSAYLFNLVTTSAGDTVSWLPQPMQSVSGSGIPDEAIITSVSANGTQITLQVPGNVTPTGSGSSITLATAPAGSGWSGPPPARDMADTAAYVCSIGFFELLDLDSKGTSISDFNVALPAGDNDNFWVNFSDTTAWTQDNWKSQLTRYFNILYTPNFTHLGGQPGISLQYPNLSPANLSLTTLASTQVLALNTGANDLTLNGSGTDWATPPDTNFYQVSANPPNGQISSSSPLLRVEVYRSDSPSDARTYWTANSPVLGPTYIYAPEVGDSFDLTVNLWVLDSGTLPMGQALPTPNYSAELTLSNSTSGGPTYQVKADPNNIIATAPGRIIQVQNPSTGTTSENAARFLSALYGFYHSSPAAPSQRDHHPKGRGPIRLAPGAPWYYSEQFGLLYGGSLPWVYGLDLDSWVYPLIDANNLWLWTPVLGWCWSNYFPYIYSNDVAAWLYIDPSSFAYNSTTGEWFYIGN